MILGCALLILVSLVFPQVWLLSSPDNEGGFAVKDLGGRVCIAGRRLTEDRLYDALLGYVRDEEAVLFLWGTRGDDMLYSVESYGEGCIFPVVVTERGNLDVAFVSLEESPKVIGILGSPLDDMVWHLRRTPGGYVAVGGVRGKDWDVWVLFLDENLRVVRSLRIGTPADEYAYSSVLFGDALYVVGRTNFRGNWDSFYLVLDAEGSLRRARVLGGEGKDYLRYVGDAGGRLLAVGRSEVSGDSDLLLVLLEEERGWLYDVGTFDYGRAVVERPFGYLVFGETEVEGNREGLVLVLRRDAEPLRVYLLGGEGAEAVRYADGEFFLGYSYSFSLTGDLILGRIGRGCGGVFRLYRVLVSEAFLDPADFPVEVKPHPLETLSLRYETRRVRYGLRDLCQE
jgi:hypothetical protein